MYGFLTLILLMSIFPLYWSLVVASHDNSAIAAYPPVLTPGTQLWHNGQAFTGLHHLLMRHAEAQVEVPVRRQVPAPVRRATEAARRR